jgi:opacity protein-like surface antigen
MKKIIMMLLAIVACSNTAFSADDSDLNGLYFGGSPSATLTLVKYGFENTNITPSTVFKTEHLQRKFQNEAGKEAGALEVFGGFRSSIGKGLYAGGEVYGGINNTKVTPYDDSASGAAVGLFKSQVERGPYLGLAALFGCRIAKGTSAYVRFGVETSEWRADVIPNSAALTKQPASMMTMTEAQIEASNKTFTKSTSGFSFVPGFGLQTRVTKNFSLRIQCSWLFAPSIEGFAQDITGYPNTTVAGTSITHSFKITQPKLGIGLCFEQ